MNEKKEKNLRVMRQLQHRAALLNWVAEMPSVWKPFALMKWRRRMPQLQRREKDPVAPPEGASNA